MAGAIELIKEWQDLIAGCLGAAAAIVVVRWTLTAERRRVDEDERRAEILLAYEIRRISEAAVGAFALIDVSHFDMMGPVDFFQICILGDPVAFKGSLETSRGFRTDGPAILAFYSRLDIVTRGIEMIVRSAGDREILVAQRKKAKRLMLLLARQGVQLVKKLEPGNDLSNLEKALDEFTAAWNAAHPAFQV